MGKPRTIPEEKLQLKDAPALIWIKVNTAIKYLWGENPKLHNIGDLVESIKKHGFQEIPRFDKHIGIKAGNGRVEALAWMEKDGGYDLPRGLAKIKNGGEWVMPLLVGTDAESNDLARSYAIDSNNLTVSGGDFDAIDMARMWNPEQYMDVLSGLAEADQLPVSVDGNTYDTLAAIFAPEEPEDDPGAQIDRAEELREKWGVQSGQLWGLGKFTRCPKCGKEHNLE